MSIHYLYLVSFIDDVVLRNSYKDHVLPSGKFRAKTASLVRAKVIRIETINSVVDLRTVVVLLED